MPNLLLRPDWYLPESAATSEHAYRNRREFLKRAGLGTLGIALLSGCAPGGSDTPESPPETTVAYDGPLDTIPADAPRDGLPAPRNPKYNIEVPPVDRPLTPHVTFASYNNFYEFKNQGDLKDLWRLTKNYDPFPWTLEVRGLVQKPQRFDVAALIKEFGLEERVYRFRCVEAWAATVPWVGFPLRKLIEKCQPLSRATHVRFVSANRPDQMPGLKNSSWYPWPYYEGLRMDEALNDLAFVATGMYGQPLPKQNGSPLRLAIPWKYGYKGPKAVVALEFTDRQPPTFWNDLQPKEYSFLSNVNPNVPHPRWSQATEQVIGPGMGRVKTLLFNGYAEQVGALYPDEPRD